MDYIKDMYDISMEALLGIGQTQRFYYINEKSNKPSPMGALEDIQFKAATRYGKISRQKKTLYILKGGESVLVEKFVFRQARGPKPNPKKDPIVEEASTKELLTKIGYKVKFVSDYDDAEFDS